MTSKTSYLSIFFGAAIFMASTSCEALREPSIRQARAYAWSHIPAELRSDFVPPGPKICGLFLLSHSALTRLKNRHSRAILGIKAVVLIAWNICYDWLPEHLTSPSGFWRFGTTKRQCISLGRRRSGKKSQTSLHPSIASTA
jgi:hypothetical protein